MASELEGRSAWLVSLESTLFSMILVSTLVGNVMTIIVIYKNKSLQTIPNYFVLSLAVSDLGMAIFSEPFCLTVLAVSGWPFGYVMCQFNGFIVLTVVSASMQTIAWMAVNRFYRVVKPSLYGRFFTFKSIKGILFSVWLLAVLVPCPYFLAGNKFVFIPSKFFCYQHVKGAFFTAFLVIFVVGFPSLVIFFCYFRIFQTVKKHNNNLQQSTNRISAEEIKITRTLFVIVVLFMLCWTPVLVIDLIDTFRGRWSLSRSTYTTYSFLAALSSMVNPICYGIMNPLFRREYLKVFNKMLCCKETSNTGNSVERTKTNSAVNVATSSRSNRVKPDSRQDDKIIRCYNVNDA